MTSRLLCVPIAVVLCLASCSSPKKAYDTFFVGDEGTQYFIKPLALVNDDGETLNLDFTFRYKQQIEGRAVTNLSVISSNIYKNIDKLSFKNAEVEFQSGDIELLFNDPTKKVFESRFSTDIGLDQLKPLFNQHDWSVTIHEQGKTNTFRPKGKTKKKIDVLSERVLVVL